MNYLLAMPSASASVQQLYREAFARYGAIALWSFRAVSSPTLEDALAVARVLRAQGDLAARRLADRIEEACRAAV
jgi:hypothetical protein